MAGGTTSGVISRPGETTRGRVAAPGRSTGAVGTVSGANQGAGTTTASRAAVAGVAAPGRAGQPDTAGAPFGSVPQLRAAAGTTSGDIARQTDDDAGLGGIRGARSELRRQMRERRRLRMVTLTALTLVVLLALPAFFGIRSASRDPVFTSLDALAVPAWAAVDAQDFSSGSRWCILNCRFRERTAQSQRTPGETATVYRNALTTAGWQPWKVNQCPDQPVDGYTCWKRDEFTLDLWVRQPSCQVDAVAQQAPGVAPTEGVVPAPPDPALCTGATVSIKVRNAITDERGRPQQQLDPSHVGETPDAILNDPVLEATPSPS
jgi:integrin beta 3